MKLRISELDALRGIAAMTVVLYHCLISFNVFYQSTLPNQALHPLVSAITYTPLHILWAGRESVLLFFVLSGFVLSLPFLQGRITSYKSFAIKRFCRIYLPYIFVMFLSSFLMSIFSDYKDIPSLTEAFNHRWEHPISWEAIVSYVLMLGYDINNVNGATWSLIHEMRISLLFPFIMLLIAHSSWMKGLFYGIGSTSALWVLFTVASKMDALGKPVTFALTSLADTFFYSMFFVIGAVLAKHSANIGVYIKRLSRTSKSALLLLSITLFNLHLVELLPLGQSRLITTLTGIVAQGIVAVGIVILLVVALNSERFSNVLNRPSLQWLGKTSYSIYLIHSVIIVCAGKYLSAFMPLPVALLLVPLITLPCAGLMYKFIESPSIALGKRLTTPKQNKVETKHVA